MMNNTNFTSTAKQHKNGSIFYVVFADGQEIGSRKTSKRTGFKFAVVARPNHANSLSIARDRLNHGIAELAKYEGYLANPQSALASEKTAFHRALLAKWLQDGTVAKWIADLKVKIVKAQEHLALRESQTQDSPEFQKWSVVAFSNTGRDAQQDWHYAMQFIPLTQPVSNTTDTTI